MLTRAHRLTSSRLFAPTIRGGARAGTRTLVVHLAVPENDAVRSPVPAAEPGDGPVMGTGRVGFVVSKSVGSAVIRNQVKRRLRHLVRERLTSLPDFAVLVVRALPPAAAASSAELGADLDRALSRVQGRVQGRVLAPRAARAGR